MKYPYQNEIDHTNPQLPWTSRPIVKVRLSLDDRHQDFLALIDSGADITLFHASVAKLLGITTFERVGIVSGISGEEMPLHYGRVTLQLEGAGKIANVEVGFVDSPGVGALLGQSGFFEHFRICFDRRNEQIEISSDLKRPDVGGHPPGH
jgi:hypothetical protein